MRDREVDRLGAALSDLMRFFASPQRDDALLREAGVSLDRALFPLLIRLAVCGPLSVEGLAAQIGRDHTTVSRQLSKLESLGLVCRRDEADRRIRAAELTDGGNQIAQAITAARGRLLTAALADWSEVDRAALALLTRRLAESLSNAARGRARQIKQ